MARSAQVITFRRSTVARIGTAAGVLVALGIGFATGLDISSSNPPATSVVAGASTSASPQSVVNSVPPRTSAGRFPEVLSCAPGSSPLVRPTVIYIGCAERVISMTAVTWSLWGQGGGSGSGTVHVNDCRPSCADGRVRNSPAFVVVSDPANGVFQTVLITPPSGIVHPQSSSQPGTGWGSG